MIVWEIKNKWMNSVAAVGPDPRSEFNPGLNVSFWEQFKPRSAGQALEWKVRPELVVLPDDGRKTSLPRADVSPFTAPGLVVNAKVRNAMGDFLSKFGQLLEVSVDGNTEYYYNVTNVVACLDHERSEFAAAYVEEPVFHEHLVPSDAAIFVEPKMRTRIFANEAAKSILEERISAGNIVGMSFKGWKNNSR
ncbi:MAG: hypothetical protein ACTHNE_18025 [Dyella sp.]|uniref:hypothetical protein n=1 Tax=Dyella sp. TaxID=1869338 RepID=UPI003F7DA2D2